MLKLGAGENPRVVASVPYPEGAIVQISRYLAKQSVLASVIAPSRATNRALSRLTRRIPALRNFSGRLSRGFDDLPQLVEIMPTLELRRLAHVLTGSGTNLGASLNSWKAEFDKVVSGRLHADVNTIIGMPGAVLETFSRNPEATRILHEVDSHPEVHNRLLLDAYPRETVAEYLHSAEHIARVTDEILLADVILTPSSFVVKQMHDVGKDLNAIVKVPYGVDLEHFRPSSSIPRSSGPVEVIYAGQMRYGKGLPFLFEAIRKLPRLHLRLVGPVVHPAVLDSMPANCTYLGVMSRKMLVDQLNECDAFVYPSLEDNFVLAIPEALACGLPVVTTDHVGAAEYMAKDDGVIIPAADSTALTAALRNVHALHVNERLERAEAFRSRATDPLTRLGCTWEEYSAQVWSTLLASQDI